jgi:protein-S-isoprenylcysteine O-methyltransferase Ste14
MAPDPTNQDSMTLDRPGIIVVPPLAWLVALVASVALGRWLPLGFLPPYPWLAGLVVGLLIIAASVAVNVSGFVAFRRAGTNVNPYKPALRVVRGGIMRFTRNPMYLGMVLFVAGLGVALSNVWGLIAAAALWAVFHWGVVRRDERYMEAKFGSPYRQLLTETRRWL